MFHFHFLRAAVSCVETAHPSSLNVSIMWFSCKLGPRIRGIGACTIRAQWTSTSAVRRLRSLTGEYAGVRSSSLTFFLNNRTAQRNPYERPGLTTQGSMETARSAAGRRKARYFRKHKQAAALSFCCLLRPLCICAACLAFGA
jgi:hypothetical protein